MVKNITYKFADREDIFRLDKLYREVFNYTITAKELEWRFIENPLIQRTFYNYIAISFKGEIIGHNAFIPATYTFDNSLLKAGLSVGGMVRKDFFGIFPKILKDLEDKMLSEGFDFLFAFPNQNAYPFHKYLGYRDHFFSYLQLDISEMAYVAEDVKCYNFFKGVHKELNEDFLKWRIYNSPINRYEVFEGGNLRAIYKRYNIDEIDLICLSFKEKHFGLRRFASFLSQFKDAKKVNIYSTNQSFYDLLTKIGFKKIEVKNKFVYKVLKPSLELDTFFMHMIDSDIF